MLILQDSQCQPAERQGRGKATLAELRDQLKAPSELSDINRQRLLELARKLKRLQGLGDEFHRVTLSPMAEEALKQAGESS